MSNPLVAAPIDTATPFSGAGLLDSGTQLASAIESGDWVEGGLAAFSTAADAVATASDPFGSLIAAGLGWLIDHFDPLKGWFNDLTGDAGEVLGFSQTWSNVEAQLDASAAELERVVTDIDDLAGEAIEAYRRFQTDAAAHIRSAGSWAGAMATGLQIASTIVQVVHDIVRDVLSQLVGSAISWAGEAVLSLGLATPWIIEQVSTRVASWTAKVGSKLTGLLRSCKTLMGLLDDLKALMREAGTLFDSVLKGTKNVAHNAQEAVAALPGIRRLDPRRNELIRSMEDWANQAQIPGYHPYGGLSGEDFIDTHLKGFDQRGFPNWRWPGDNGFDTSRPIVPANGVVPPGTILDRLAPVKGLGDHGEYVSPPGTAFPTQSLPPDRLAPAFQHYQIEVLKPLPDEVRIGHIAEDFQQPGGGIQIHFPGGISDWIKAGYIRVK